MARGFNYAPGASAEVQAAIEPGLTKDQLVEFGASRNALVRAAIAARADCPLGLMVTLAHDYSAEVRAEIARYADRVLAPALGDAIARLLREAGIAGAIEDGKDAQSPKPPPGRVARTTRSRPR